MESQNAVYTQKYPKYEKKEKESCEGKSRSLVLLVKLLRNLLAHTASYGLLYNICVPVLSYASDVVVFHHREMESLHVAVNDLIRRIFSYNRWESIRTLRESFGYLSLTEIFAKRELSFE